MEHELKTWPEWYQDIENGIKNFEVRINDRGFKIGDTLWLREYKPESGTYTGRSVKRKITCVYSELPGLDRKHVVLGLALDCQSCKAQTEQETAQKICEALKKPCVLHGNRLIDCFVCRVEFWKSKGVE